MCPRAVPMLALTISVFMLAACGPTTEQRTTQLLDQRLQTELAPDLKAGKMALQPLPDGVRVTLQTSSMFPDDVKAMADQYPEIRASIIEALPDPSLLRIQVSDTSALPLEQREARINNVSTYFADYGLGSSLQPAALTASTPAGTGPAGLTITMSIQCPHRQDGAGYGDGKAEPACN